MTRTGDDQHLLATTEEVAAYLQVPPRTLDTWAHRGVGPTFSKVGRHRRYRWEDVERYLDSSSATERFRRYRFGARPGDTTIQCDRCGSLWWPEADQPFAEVLDGMLAHEFRCNEVEDLPVWGTPAG